MGGRETDELCYIQGDINSHCDFVVEFFSLVKTKGSVNMASVCRSCYGLAGLAESGCDSDTL